MNGRLKGAVKSAEIRTFSRRSEKDDRLHHTGMDIRGGAGKRLDASDPVGIVPATIFPACTMLEGKRIALGRSGL